MDIRDNKGNAGNRVSRVSQRSAWDHKQRGTMKNKAMLQKMACLDTPHMGCSQKNNLTAQLSPLQPENQQVHRTGALAESS